MAVPLLEGDQAQQVDHVAVAWAAHDARQRGPGVAQPGHGGEIPAQAGLLPLPGGVPREPIHQRPIYQGEDPIRLGLAHPLGQTLHLGGGEPDVQQVALHQPALLIEILVREKDGGVAVRPRARVAAMLEDDAADVQQIVQRHAVAVGLHR